MSVYPHIQIVHRSRVRPGRQERRALRGPLSATRRRGIEPEYCRQDLAWAVARQTRRGPARYSAVGNDTGKPKVSRCGERSPYDVTCPARRQPVSRLRGDASIRKSRPVYQRFLPVPPLLSRSSVFRIGDCRARQRRSMFCDPSTYDPVSLWPSNLRADDPIGTQQSNESAHCGPGRPSRLARGSIRKCDKEANVTKVILVGTC